MTKVGQLFEEEKIEYGKQVAEQVIEQMKQEAEALAKQREIEIVRTLVQSGIPMTKIYPIIKILTKTDVEKLAKEIIS